MNHLNLLASLFMAAGVTFTLPAQATLHDRGGGLIYDDVLNVTWLQDANYAKTSGYDADGRLTWVQAMTWAADLSYYDNVRGVTYNDWRLPHFVDTGAPGCDYTYFGTDCGYNVQTASGGAVYSEMASLFYDTLGNKGYFSATGTPQAGFGLTNAGPFNNFQNYTYWLDSLYAPDTRYAWAFYGEYGSQTFGLNDYEHYVLAVRTGDVAAVPEPESYALMLMGLGLVGWKVRRRG